jgi:hypothetical protein
MMRTYIVVATPIFAAALTLPFVASQGLSLAAAPAPGAKAATAPAPAEPPSNCKTFGAGKCCSSNVTMHLAKEAVFSACGESDATFIGEAASKDMMTCKYHFRVEGEKSEDTVVQVYVGTGKEIPDRPTDPFFSYKRVGKKVWMTDKAKSPKAAAMSNATTGLYTAGKGFYVMVSASTKVCTRSEVAALAKALK